MSYSRQIWPPSFGRVPVPLVTLAIDARGAVDTGCRLAPLVGTAAVEGGRQLLVGPPVAASTIGGGVAGAWANAKPMPPAASAATIKTSFHVPVMHLLLAGRKTTRSAPIIIFSMRCNGVGCLSSGGVGRRRSI